MIQEGQLERCCPVPNVENEHSDNEAMMETCGPLLQSGDKDGVLVN